MNYQSIPLVAVLSSGLFGQPPAPVFTSAQADAGRIAYERTCGKCHTNTLLGRKGEPGELPPVASLPPHYQKFIGTRGLVPPLAGKVFIERWGAKTAAELIARFQVTADDKFFQFEDMKDETVVNITAYALQVSGAKSGSQPLTRKTAAIVSSLVSDLMPAVQQTALIQKYCAVCHTDAARNGGLTLQHFNAAEAAPSLAAMLVSKLNGGAMGAAGIKPPDQATVIALTEALTAKSAGAREWTTEHTSDTLTASILRELPSARNSGVNALYRLIVGCNARTHEGEMQLSWAPSPQNGRLSVVVDGKKTYRYNVEGSETMGNGSKGTTGPAAMSLSRIPLPDKSLVISDLFPNETVEFSFNDLPQSARQSFAPCFR